MFYRNFLNDPENWPKSCIVDSDNGKQVVASVVIKSNAPVNHYNIENFSPHVLHKDVILKLVRMKITNPTGKQTFLRSWGRQRHRSWNAVFTCSNRTENFGICEFSTRNYLRSSKHLDAHPNGKLFFLEINPRNKYLNFTIQPVDVFKNSHISDPLALGCWSGHFYKVNSSYRTYACPGEPDNSSSNSAPMENRFFLFYKDTLNYPNDESVQG